ncbi:MAG: hypothetical protein A3G33_07245 [Omnitrophica bacterium RIFCSPLOWO2_12_FULL_44_17]|uniref:Uncharacterized protein n=1 Tax=Candidatus Danuiimicrobium aquiferis TaxID=1801832 RepID=A0A1G1KYS2_9BACT|nr:MAG: hypothetical protein A3B72_07545 [Omnitrophica bacterium RIFCSPHIGHO2_02_FULL_45_28]OGW90399.1 MAG: hypothetical protein A3E74_07280 [Omnitrophica bacterium RIFCSPHIGHO2_12_FULL_44_12]OGW98021.1 MAG: hypothetical protein A3G33_07245 [Omnitrophica bacterium RIFCSPLOWO2_12_FULL_44_17]OGX03534.1 MAG: hypothetical protein A3J12_02985 [Omnitrophica bacterium RIFCSPLOWO2_02_FULL_44_11]
MNCENPARFVIPAKAGIQMSSRVPRSEARGIHKNAGCPLKTCGHDTNENQQYFQMNRYKKSILMCRRNFDKRQPKVERIKLYDKQV